LEEIGLKGEEVELWISYFTTTLNRWGIRCATFSTGRESNGIKRCTGLTTSVEPKKGERPHKRLSILDPFRTIADRPNSKRVRALPKTVREPEQRDGNCQRTVGTE
jgi:hypothetical protein